MAKKSKQDKKEKKSKGGKKGKAAKDVELEEEEEDPSHDDDADFIEEAEEDEGTEELTAADVETMTKEKLEKTMNHLRNTFSQVRTGRAMPGMLDNIQVEAYGTTMALHTLASVSVRGAHQLVVSLHDQTIATDVEKAIRECGLSLNPVVQANNTIQIQIPKLTKEVRQQVVKMVAKHAEEAKQAARNQRKQMLDLVKKRVASEDDQRRYEKVVQKQVDEVLQTMDTLKVSKEKDIAEA